MLMKSCVRKLALVLYLLSSIYMTQVMADQPVKTSITDVTVFTDRAQVTRSYENTFEKGEHSLIFDDLPAAIDQNSIQVNGQGLATLLDVKFEKKYLTFSSDEKKQELEKQLSVLQDERKELEDSIAQVAAEKTFVINISKKLTSVSEKDNETILDPQKWMKMLSFYRSKLSSLDQDMREASVKIREIKLKIEKVESELANLNSNTAKQRNQVRVTLNMPASGPVKLKLSYVVIGPSWKPLYDLRVDSNSKTMMLIYKALVKQNSGEDWRDVNLKLSTAKPNISGVQPELLPWRLEFKELLLQSRKRLYKYDEASSGGFAARAEVNKSVAAKPKEFDYSDQQAIAGRGSKVDSNSSSVVFIVQGKMTIKNDNNPHQATILNKSFKADLKYSIVPKKAEHAYLKAQIINSTDYPFLSGMANVFLDSNFVAHTRLEEVAPREKFWTYLGVDSGIKVEYKFIKKYEEEVGVFNKSKRNTYEYIITVTNNKVHNIDVYVHDQIPIAGHEDIKVNLLVPVINEDTKQVKLDKQKFIEWFYRPKAGETIEIPFKYSVEYPIDKELNNVYQK